MSIKLKIYYDTDIATVKYNGGYPFESGTSYSFDGTSYTKLFSYVLKNPNATLPNDKMYFFWGDNKYFIYLNEPLNGTNKYDFSESDVVDAFNNLTSNNSNISPFLCLISARYKVNGELNTKRPLIVCGDFVSKNVVTSGSTDTITVTFDKYLTSVKLYYRNSNGGQYEDYSKGISADKHTFTATVPHIPINEGLSTDNDYSFIVVPTLTDQTPEQPANSANITLQYNNGIENKNIVFPNQTAGTITGTVQAADGYSITGIKQAYYQDNYGYKTTLKNLVATKITDKEYNFSVDLADSDITFFKNNITKKLMLTVTTSSTTISANVNVKYNNGASTQTLPFTSIKAGQKITGELNAANGYTITSVTRAYYKDNQGYQLNVTNFIATKVSSYKYSFSFELTETDIKQFTKNPNYFVTIAVKTAKELGNINIDTNRLVNCSVSPSTVTQDTESQITLSADLGYILNGNGTYTVDGKETSFTCNNADSYSFTVTANKTVAVAFTATKVETKPAAISHTYILDEIGYNLLGKQYIQAVNSSGDGFSQYDYSKFVNYLYVIPFKVSENITKPTKTISIGKTSLNVQCNYVTHEALTINLGSIELPTKDSTDYKVNDVQLIVPYCENIELPYSVLGSTINIAMQINLLNESATLIVSQNNTVIVTRGTEIFTDLPLYFTAGTKDTLVKTFKTQYQNTVKQAYIYITYNKPITNLTSYSTNEHGTLSNYKGFTRVTRGTLKNSINEEIDSLIIDRLQQGVIIK